MSGRSLSFYRSGAAIAVLALLASACSGGAGGSHGSGALPQSGSTASKASGVGGITGISARIAAAIGSQGNTAAPVRNAAPIVPSNVTTAEPPVARPNETPCVVQLFSAFDFADFNPKSFAYAPPPGCPGPWAKVVLSADFNVDAGRQFDRTASIWIAGTNVYFGTTAEPSHSLAPSWHVERDITDLSAILRQAQSGFVNLGNLVNNTYTSHIHGSAQIQFYPANQRFPAPEVADNVYPLSDSTYGVVSLNSPQTPLAGTFSFPPNVKAAYLDVFLQSQSNDEFWYTCFPDDLAGTIPNCGNTAFREGEVAIDGTPAGVAPVYPWIYTGGIDPYLWRPIPGIETLNFKPYRVNLTPFAALLSDGNPHRVTVNLFNVGSYFSTNAALLVFLDRNTPHITGAIVSNGTQLNPSPVVTENVVFNSSGVGSGPVNVTSTHTVSIDGYAMTSAGRIETKINQTISFKNLQQIQANPSETIFDQTINQDTNIFSNVTTIKGFGGSTTTREMRDWPLKVAVNFTASPDGSATQTASITQGKHETIERHGGGSEDGGPLHSSLDEQDTASDTLTINADNTVTPTNGTSQQSYSARGIRGFCYAKVVASQNYLLTRQFGGFCGGSDR